MHPWTRAGALVAALLTLVFAGCGGDDGPSQSDSAITTTQRATFFGLVNGNDDSATTGTYAWKGVPYAKPPVGDLRWRAPVDPDNWSTPRAAHQFGNACAQSGRLYGPGSNNRYDATIGTTLGQTLGSEDCLYLNIWQPAGATAALPVIVFIHGGSNITGYTADPVYDGANLARTARAVVVTVNYRLGVLGFLNVPQLKTGTDANTDSGNFALLDLIKSLQFINRNIASFGGDPNNVTLMGQSAGATNIDSLITMPQVINASPRLFHKLVPISGGISLASNLPPGNLPALNPASSALAQGNALLSQLLIADGRATDNASAQAYAAAQGATQIATYLRGKSADAILSTVVQKLAPLGVSGSNPIPDGVVLPTDPVGAVRAGNFLKVPQLVANTRDEGKLFPTFLALSPALGGISGRLLTDAQVFSIAFGYDPNAAPQTTVQAWIPAAYLPTSTPVTGFTARTAALNAIFFIANRDNLIPLVKAQAPVWYWRFDWDQEPAPFDEIFGAAHGFDMPFVFGNFGPSLYSNIANSTTNQPGRLALSDAMMRSLGAFALNGDPNNAALGVNWPQWPAQLVFDATDTAKVITVQP